MTVSAVLDSAGRRRSPATMPGYHSRRAPRNKGQLYPADPPTVEEIIAVMRQTPDDRHGARLRAVIVVLWRGGLRIQEALALAERDLDPRRGSLLVRSGKVAAGARSGWTRGGGSSSRRGSRHASSCRSGRCSASSTAPLAGGPGRAPGSAPSSAGWRPRRESAAGSRRISCAMRTPLSSLEKACRSTHSAPARPRQPRHDQHLPAGHRHRGDHRRRAHPARADDVSDRWTPALTNAPAAGAFTRRSRPRASDRFAVRSDRHEGFAADRPARSIVVRSGRIPLAAGNARIRARLR
jgi:hypothetical protein